MRAVSGAPEAQNQLRALVAGRDEPFRTELVAELEARSVLVVAALDDGALAAGRAGLLRPDLVLIEDRLPSFVSAQVMHRVRQQSAGVVVAVRVMDDMHLRAVLTAGADLAVGRRIPAAELVRRTLQHHRNGEVITLPGAHHPPVGPLQRDLLTPI